jgi:hypothetical protein
MLDAVDSVQPSREARSVGSERSNMGEDISWRAVERVDRRQFILMLD